VFSSLNHLPTVSACTLLIRSAKHALCCYNLATDEIMKGLKRIKFTRDEKLILILLVCLSLGYWWISGHVWFCIDNHKISINGRFLAKGSDYSCFKSLGGDIFSYHQDHGTQYFISPKNNEVSPISVSLRSDQGQGADIDVFGIQKIYADAPPPSNNWTFTGNAHDPRFMEQRIVAASGGWFRPENAQEMRLEVVSDISANERTIETFDLAKVLAKGYLYKPPNSPDGKGDFLNIEQTWRVRIIKAGSGTVNGSAHLELVPGGYRQTSQKTKTGKDQAVPASCEAMSYHFNVYPLTGRVQMEKDSDHITGYVRDDLNPRKDHVVPRFDNGQIIVQKAVLYRTATGMKLEMYLDMTGKGDHFEKVLEFEDHGQWGPTQGGNVECHCSEYVVLSMARVAIGYRCDNMVDLQFKDMSIRSIDPSKPLHPTMAARSNEAH